MKKRKLSSLETSNTSVNYNWRFSLSIAEINQQIEIIEQTAVRCDDRETMKPRFNDMATRFEQQIRMESRSKEEYFAKIASATEELVQKFGKKPRLQTAINTGVTTTTQPAMTINHFNVLPNIRSILNQPVGPFLFHPPQSQDLLKILSEAALHEQNTLNP